MSLKNAVLAFLMVSAAVVSGLALASNPRAEAASSVSAANTAAPPCPTGDSCVTLPCSTGTCPTVQAGPTHDLGTNPAQYAFVKLYNFPPGDEPEIAECTDIAPLSDSAPLCSDSPPPLYAPIFSDGTGFISYQVVEDESGPGQTPISGEVLGDDAVKKTFYCDNGPDLCSLVVFDQNIDGSSVPDAANTAVLPVTYAASTGGCPGATRQHRERLRDRRADRFRQPVRMHRQQQGDCLQHRPRFGIGRKRSRRGSGPDRLYGRPRGTDEQSVLGGAKSHYALIPVAASADVVGFSADIQGFPPNNRTLYPQANFELTPNMVAGMIADPTIYDGVGAADLLAGVKCLNPGIPPPKKIDPCPGEEVLNSISGFQPEQSYVTYVRSDTAGVTDELLHWLCAAPDHTVPIAGKNETETDTAAQILESTKWSDSSLDGTCPKTDQFPGLASPNVLDADLNPQNQAKALYSQVSQNAVPPREAGFAVMNWYQALYFGLNPAALQNAAGQFVSPSAASIDAAIADATTNPDGTLAFNYTDTSDASAYPEPVVLYAAVSTAPQPATQANAIKKVLDNVLALTASPGSASLPAGLAALPASLTSIAEADIAKDIVALPPTGGNKPGGGNGSGSGSTHHSGGGSQAGSGGNGSSLGGSQTSGGTSGGGGQSSSSPTPAKNLDAAHELGKRQARPFDQRQPRIAAAFARDLSCDTGRARRA